MFIAGSLTNILLAIVLVMNIGLFMILDLEMFNRVMDLIVCVYMIIAILIVIISANSRLPFSIDGPKTYALKKMRKIPDWQSKFFGKWEKLTRTGFYEFMMFNGAPKTVAYVNRDAYFGQELVDVAGDGSQIKINAFGLPAGEGSIFAVGESEVTAKEGQGKDSAQRTFTGKYWWDNNEKSLKFKMAYDESKVIVEQTRKVDDNDVMYFKATNIKPDKTSSSFEATMRRMKLNPNSGSNSS